MASNKADLLQGTLDMLVMRAVAMRRSTATHSCTASSSSPADGSTFPKGSLYPALHRLENQGALGSE